MNYFKYIVLSIVISIVFPARAGSFEDFFVYLRNDNAGGVIELLNRGFDPNTKNEKGQPGLTVAMQERSHQAARALLATASTDVNALNSAGESALMMAALKGDMDGATMLLERGAQVNKSGWTPLHYAATGPEPRLVRLLIDRGAELNAPSPNGTTPLMMAAQYGSEDSVKLLLERGADPKLRNDLKLSAVDFALKAGRSSLAARLEALQR
jgi:ankyrin repeat protein